MTLRAKELRYFPNPFSDYDPTLGTPKIPAHQLTTRINELVFQVEQKFPPIDRNGDDGIYLGTAGISYMFYHLSKVPTLIANKEVYLQKALKYIRPAIKVANTARSDNSYSPSFILGPAGVYAVASALFHSLGDENQSKHYREEYYNTAKYCSNVNFLKAGSDELFVGRAGYILGALWLSKETNTPLQKQDLHHLCQVIVSSGREYSKRNHSSCPLMYSYYEVEYIGAAHGLSSILQTLLSVPHFLEENPHDQPDIRAAIDFILNTQDTEGNFPAATDEIGTSSKLVHWCHGAGGLIYLMAKAYLIFKEEKYLQSCKNMADLIWKKGLLKKGPSLCHGVAGNGYTFLIMYRLTGEAQYLYQAICFADFIENDLFKENSRVPDNPYSLYEGIAGTVCYLADLMQPHLAAFPFSDIF